ncbi:mediator of RNA polymerase II transcription subunit 1-like protein [Pitangus sulphuratus]|nr:mediator of RNA polymerase II transcription subunit 1-like protein [Pitangus sulphuratus]
MQPLSQELLSFQFNFQWKRQRMTDIFTGRSLHNLLPDAKIPVEESCFNSLIILVALLWTRFYSQVSFCAEDPNLDTALQNSYYADKDNPLRRPVSHAPDSPLLSCMEKIERTLHAKSMFSVMNALESLSRQKGLNVHVSPSGTSCYITSTMFYLEAQLEKDGHVMDVKLAHFGEVPMVCDDLVQLLSEIKAKGYLALKALEKDLYSMSLLDRRMWNANEFSPTKKLEAFLQFGNPRHAKQDLLNSCALPKTFWETASLQSLGTPMNIEFYISPYQILEAELNPGSQVCGTKTVVTVEGSDMLHKLPLSPLIVDPQSGEDSCMSVPVVMRAIFRNAAKVKADSETQDMDVDTKQPHEPPSEQITDSHSLHESPSVAGQHDLVVTDKPSITDSTEENLSTAKLETLDDSMEKSNLSPRTETLCRTEEN